MTDEEKEMLGKLIGKVAFHDVIIGGLPRESDFVCSDKTILQIFPGNDIISENARSGYRSAIDSFNSSS